MNVNINTRDNRNSIYSDSSAHSSDLRSTNQDNVDRFDKAMSDTASKDETHKTLHDTSYKSDKFLNAPFDSSSSSQKLGLTNANTGADAYVSSSSQGESLLNQALGSSANPNDIHNKTSAQKQGSDFASLLNTADDKSETADNTSELSQIFSSLLNQSSNTASHSSHMAAADGVAPLTDANEIDKLNDLASTIVDRILVSDPKFSATSQVMLTLSHNSAFANMDIMLERTLDGTLSVEIYTKSKEQTRDVVRIRQDITDALEKHESGLVRLTITQEQDSEHNSEKSK